MFNWYLFLSILFISIPGILINTPVFLRGEPVDSQGSWLKRFLISFFSTIYSILKNILIVSIFTAIGVLLHPIIKSNAPVFIAIIKKENLWQVLKIELFYASLFGIIGAIVFIYFYYIFLRLKVNKESIATMEDLRMKRYLSGRIIYDGMIAEIIMRWGLLSLIIWLFNIYLGSINNYIRLIAIAILGVMSGLVRLLIYFRKGCEITKAFIGLVFFSNIIASLIFGVLFWWRGLMAAMIAHMFFNLLWHPFDVYCYKQRKYNKYKR
ncbi:hypothetical protein U472_14265 [Orenia metallireducens]|uniref:CAAX protease self-immunity n=1 Tax=Orenia metallireducens TaxID=1413210 RepID=A0A1C0A5W1_9FIRM|nr:hypothetical protein [Orenia metallireducens]OCL25503.1 hypothetical protein U472_14265 [Orenia metallireducens]